MTKPVVLMKPVGQAAASYLGMYGLQNPWVQWALARDPAAVAEMPRRRGRRPRCPSCRRVMTYRRNGWECNRQWYTHTCNTRIEPGILLDRGKLYDDDGHPVDALALVGKVVEVVYDRGKWRARPTV